jgi:hypothetical protein
LKEVNTSTHNNRCNQVPPTFEVSQSGLVGFSICCTPSIEMFGVLTSSQLTQVNTPTRNNQISQVSLSFEVFRTPLEEFSNSSIAAIEMS